eukprot:IDg16785t1
MFRHHPHCSPFQRRRLPVLPACAGVLKGDARAVGRIRRARRRQLADDSSTTRRRIHACAQARVFSDLRPCGGPLRELQVALRDVCASALPRV